MNVVKRQKSTVKRYIAWHGHRTVETFLMGLTHHELTKDTITCHTV